MSSLINIYSLPKKKSLKEDNRLKIYERVLKMCHHRIKTASNNSEDYTFFTIPNIVMGMPRFDTVSCGDYIMSKLAANGFKILNMGENFIFISWAHINFSEEKERKMEEHIQEINELEDYKNNGATPPAVYPTLRDDVYSQDTISITNSNNMNNRNNRNNRNNNFRPIYDTPSTEKYLLT